MEEDAEDCGRRPTKACQCERDHKGVFPLHIFSHAMQEKQGDWFLAGQLGRDKRASLEGLSGMEEADSRDQSLESEDTDRGIILRKQEWTSLLAFEGADWAKLRYLYVGAE